ncbi:MAG: hypothetical protein AABZ33_09110 [Chloroflexota bacterium]
MPLHLPGHRVTRTAAALLLAAASMVTTLPGPAPVFALDPPRPLPGYTPAFVTEREPGVWYDCTWASAQMLLDKWTSGVTIVDRKRLRALSGDDDGGSNLTDVERAFAEIGFPLESSPFGSTSITWPKLLDRLSQGGGAILLGDYSRLPRVNGRWDRAFWSGERENDDHALYLDRYDPKTRRIFVMDPLAPAGWTGEWIRVSALKLFAWRTGGGRLWAALTPPALAGPFAGVDLGDPVATADASALRVSWPVEGMQEGWTYPGSSATAEFIPVSEADPIDPMDPIVAARPAVVPAAVRAFPADEFPPAPPDLSPTLVDGLLNASVPLPTTPGVYRVTVSLTDHRTGAPIATAGPLSLYVPGPRAASFDLPEHVSAEPGTLAAILIAVRNAGTESWLEPAPVPSVPPDLQPHRNTRLVGTWVAMPVAGFEETAGPDGIATPAVTTAPAPIDLGPLALEPGDGLVIEALVRMPTVAGSWRLIIDVVDDQVGSFALTGSAPGVVVVEVRAPVAGSNLH